MSGSTRGVFTEVLSPRIRLYAWSTLLLGLIALPTAADSVGVAQDYLRVLFLKPMGLQRAVLRVETAPYFAECPPDAITIRVFGSGDPHAPELFKIDTLVYDDKVDFLFAEGTMLESFTSDDPPMNIEQTLVYLTKQNGWLKMENSGKPAYKPGFIEWWMRDPHPNSIHVTKIRGIHFWKKSGLPRMIGSPARVSGNHCGPPDDRFPVLPQPEDLPQRK